MPNFRKKLWILVGSFTILVLLIGIFILKNIQSPRLDYATYRALLRNGMIQKARIIDNMVYLQSGSKEFMIPKELIDVKELYRSVPVSVPSPVVEEVVDAGIILTLIFFVGYILYYLRQQRREPIPIKHQIQIAPMEQPQDLKYEISPQVSNVTFRDVAGIDEVKEELEEIIDFLKNSKKYTEFGVRMPKGVLLVGPPGVGKTLIAKAVAGEAGVPFFYQSGSAFVQIYVGMGAKRVRELFAKAKEMAPSIIFIDEIDAVGKARGGMRNDERESTLNQLLTEMDGFESSQGVIVIGATNKIEVLDEALLRPGRFDRRVFISLPNKDERKRILEIYLRKIPHNVDIDRVAQMSVGFSGAALASLVNEAALAALKKGKRRVELEDFEEVKDKVLFGKKKILVFSEREKEIQSIYQAAKALVAYWYGMDIERISLIDTRLKEVDKEIVSRSEYLAKIKVYLAGFVALELFFGEKFSNAAEDLHRAKALAEEMVHHYGMGESLFAQSADVMHILQEAQDELKKYLTSHQNLVQRIAGVLRQKEIITKEDIQRLQDALF